MCTVVILYRPGHAWPLILGANRDEMAGRSWQPPARHWPDRPEVVAGLDDLAGGTWLGLNDHGLVAGVLNRPGTLGPAEGFRSRGELPLEALEHAEADVAAEALAHLEPGSWRPFNLVIADRRSAWWLRGDGRRMRAEALPEGLSMITAHDRNDPASPRIRRYLPAFERAAPPDPEAGDWAAWQALLADAGDGEDAAMTLRRADGFGTTSASLLALPAPGRIDAEPVWLFAPGPPDREAFAPVSL